MQTIKVNKIMAVVFMMAIIFGGCKKYEEGPTFSLLSKKARLTGTWEIVEMDGESLSDNMTMTFEKDGKFTMTYTYDGSSYSEEGEWEWVSDKEAVQVSMDGSVDESTITRLTNSELWYIDDDNTTYKCEKQ